MYFGTFCSILYMLLLKNTFIKRRRKTDKFAFHPNLKQGVCVPCLHAPAALHNIYFSSKINVDHLCKQSKLAREQVFSTQGTQFWREKLESFNHIGYSKKACSVSRRISSAYQSYGHVLLSTILINFYFDQAMMYRCYQILVLEREGRH